MAWNKDVETKNYFINIIKNHAMNVNPNINEYDMFLSFFYGIRQQVCFELYIDEIYDIFISRIDESGVSSQFNGTHTTFSG